MFLEHAVFRLADSDDGVRWHAVRLLAVIGSEKDCSPIISLLSDEETVVRYGAAKALAKIGGKREIAAMNVWLKVGNHRDDKDYLRHVEKCRDEIKTRLDRPNRPRE